MPVTRTTAPLAALVLGVIGCSSATPDAGRVAIKGKLVDKGQPFVFDPSKVALPKGGTAAPPGTSSESALQVSFISTETKESFPATVNAAAGTFEVSLKPGRYKVVVTTKVGFAPDAPDFFKGSYSAEKSQVIRDVKEGEEVVIDVSKPQG